MTLKAVETERKAMEKSFDDRIKRLIAETESVVWADDFASLALWSEWSKTAAEEKVGTRRMKGRLKRVDWNAQPVCHAPVIGSINKRQIVMSLDFAEVNGRRVCFACFISPLADFAAGEKWLRARMPLLSKDEDFVDALNFVNAIYPRKKTEEIEK